MAAATQKIWSWRPKMFWAGREGMAKTERLPHEGARAVPGSLHSGVFSEIKMLDVSGQSLRVGIRRD